jgi:hypothetical protein
MLRARFVWPTLIGLLAVNLVAGVLWMRSLRGAVRIATVNAPSGVETANGKPFFWLGQEQTHVVLDANGVGSAELDFVPTLGPSLPGVPRRHLLVMMGNRHARVVDIEATPRVLIVVPVVKGRNDVVMQVLDRPAVEARPGADRRELLLGVGDLTARETSRGLTEGESCYALFTAGWYHVERNGADWVRWMAGSGYILVVVPAAGSVTFGGEIISAIRPNEITVRVNGSARTRWRLDGSGFGSGPIPIGRIPLEAGLNLLSFESGAQPVTLSTDTRPLAAALKNVTIRLSPEGRPCTIRQ